MNTKNTVRFSKQREAVLNVLKGTTSHPTAAWIFENVRKEIPNISLGTVYRNLARLSEDGIILKIDGGDGVERFDADTKDHYHMMCKHCGSVSDVFIDYADELDKKASEFCGCRIDCHKLMFCGICPNCNQSKN